MAVRFTEDQQRAIDTLDKSILVSAAAGSGKTAVLIERIISIILEGKANVDEMLVVTFTTAAAAEMRLRLSAKIRERMRDHPEDRPRLRDQLSRLYKAYISTIDSFALRVIREFFYKTDIEPDFGTCDAVQSELLMREAAADLFEEGFANDGIIGEIDGCRIGFREFLRLYSKDRSEDAFKDDMIEAYGRLRTMPDYFNWAYGKAENLKVTPDDFDGSELSRIMFEDAVDSFRVACDAAGEVRDLMCEYGLDKLFEEKLFREYEEMHDILDALEHGSGGTDMIARIAGIKYETLKARKDEKEAFEPIKGDVKALREVYKNEIKGWCNKYTAPDFEIRLTELNETYKYTVYYIRLLEEFEKRYLAKKKERRVMDFADMEHNAVRILADDEAAVTLRRRFRYIFVDEYQDTNNIQEYLIGKVSRPDNVFKVGDVKQSIYKFRQAEPEIFEKMYRYYSDPSNKDGITIDLSRNFRSNDATIQYINTVFTEVMDGYDDKARLYTGCQCDPEYDFVPEIHLLTDDGADQEEDLDDVDAEIESLGKSEAEAIYIADIAAGLIGQEFMDTKTGEIRPVRASDIAILFRSVKVRGDIISRALRSRGVEPHVDEEDDYFDTVEISVALSLLTCIDNMKRDIPLIAALHSEVFGWSPEDLAAVRIAHLEHERGAAGEDQDKSTGARPRAAYWEALRWYRDNGPEGELRDRAVYARDKILEWRRLSRMMPLEDFIWRVLTDSGYYRMAGAMSGGSRRQANLRVLADRAGKFSSENVSSLSSYIAFLEVMKKKKISTGQAKLSGSDDDVVRISTIHKSKGLEYPFVIVGGLGSRFRSDGNSRNFSFDSAIGVGMPYVDPARKYWRSSVIQRAINSKSNRDGFKEELRVLYVAMTRARNKLILVGTCKSEDDLMKYTAHPANFLKVMRKVLRTDHSVCHVQPLVRKSGSGKQDAKSAADNIPQALSPQAEALYTEVDERFRYEYPYKDLLTAKAKYSVSAIRREELDAEAASEVPDPEAPETDGGGVTKADDEVVRLWDLSQTRKKAGAADIGIAYHRIMEYLDFSKVLKPDGTVDEELIRQSAGFLEESGALDETAYQDVDLGRIAGFFRTDLGIRAAHAALAGKLRKEKPFTLKTVRNGREMLVQGVIDCCFEEDGRMILIDYKSNFVKPGRSHEKELERIRHEYKVQIELYSQAVSIGTGLDVSEAYLYLFATGEYIEM